MQGSSYIICGNLHHQNIIQRQMKECPEYDSYIFARPLLRSPWPQMKNLVVTSHDSIEWFVLELFLKEAWLCFKYISWGTFFTRKCLSTAAMLWRHWRTSLCWVGCWYETQALFSVVARVWINILDNMSTTAFRHAHSWLQWPDDDDWWWWDLAWKKSQKTLDTYNEMKHEAPGVWAS